MNKSRVEWLGVALIAIMGCTKTMTPDEPLPAEDGGHSNDTADASAAHMGNGTHSGSSDSQNGGSGDQPVRDAGTVSQQDPARPPMRCVRGSDARIDKIDLLFVVDNSGSMKEEQAALRAQFPHMISTLTAGGANDLHLGVVSSDMGLVGISDIKDCAGLGDDGIMQSDGRMPGCQNAYPRFLSYDAASDSAEQVAADFACIAALGTDGCGFEQQLESGLKALWPGQDDRVTFLGDVNGFGTMGHGDNENAGFLRSDPDQGLSLIAIVVVTDEEDCSSLNTVHFTPATYLDPNNPADAELMKEGLNVRCHSNPQNLYPPQRYTNAFKALRPGNEDLVMFAAIVGVPLETVAESVLADTNFADPAARDRFYSDILNHPLMQEEIDPQGNADPADDTLRPSCNTPSGLAYPPRRIVQVAQGFGQNGIVQSICQDDFGPAMDAIASHIGDQLANAACP